MSCTCESEIRIRRQRDGWQGGNPLYGKSVAVSVRVHFGECMMCDELLRSWTVNQF